MSNFFGIIEVAEKLNVSQKKISRHIANGELQPIRIGRDYKIPSYELDDFIENNEIRKSYGEI